MREQIEALIPRQYSKPLKASDGADLRVFSYIEKDEFRLVTKFVPASMFKKLNLEEIIATGQIEKKFLIGYETDDRGYKNLNSVVAV